MPLTYVDFGTLQWGAGEHGDGLALAENVVPAFGLKRPIEGWNQNGSNQVSDVLLNSVHAHVWPENSSAASYVGDKVTEFHGSKTDIYVYDRSLNTWTSVRTGLAAAGEPPATRFASYGNDVWATNRIDNLQVRTNNSGNFVDGTTTSTFKPIAREICVVRNYMMAFDLANASHFSDSYAWSVPGNPAVWDAAASGGGGTGRITSRPGQIMRAIGGEFARVFKRSSMHALQFTGDVVGTNGGTWREDVLSDGVGTPWPSSVVVGDQGALYFLGQDGYFYRQTGMNPPDRVSPFAVSAYLADAAFSPGAINRSVPATMAEEDLWVQGAYNPLTGVVFWVYRGLSDGVRTKTRGVFYSTVTGEFTTWDAAGSGSGTPTIQTLGGLPSPGSATETLAGLVMTTASGVSHTFRWTFSAINVFRVRLITRKQALSLSQQETPIAAPVEIKGVIPVISTEVMTNSSSPVYELDEFNPIPSALEISVIVSNDPNFKVISDSSGQVNPRRETATAVDNADLDTDLFPFAESQGTWQIFELRLDNTAGLALRAMPGIWVSWELLS